MRTSLLLLLYLISPAAWAAGASVSVLDAQHRPVENVVVTFESTGGEHNAIPKSLATSQHTIIDQKNLRFVPEISVIRTGTLIEFPNSDNVRHQVYSFSPAKSFKLALYAGRVYPPLLFDHAGLVTIGCNIHDAMIGFVYVTDSPWYGMTDAKGRLQLPALPAGDYRVVLWHPRFAESEAQIERPLSVVAQADASLLVTLTRPMQGEPVNNVVSRWKSY